MNTAIDMPLFSSARLALREALNRAGCDSRWSAEPGAGWLRLRAPHGCGGPVSEPGVADLLMVSARLPVGVRLVLDPARRPWFEAEVRCLQGDSGLAGEVVEPGELPALIPEAVRLLEPVLARSPAGWADPCLAPGDLPAGLAEILEADGEWTLHPRAGCLVVDLDTRDGLLQAQLSGVPGGILAEVEVLRGDDQWAAPTPAAIGAVMLEAVSRLRLVRAAADWRGAGGPAAWFQVAIPHSQLAPGVLQDALSALALAWEDAAEEAALLQSPATAARYLAIRGWAARPDEPNINPDNQQGA